MGFMSKVFIIFKHSTVEPLIGIYILSNMIALLTTLNLNMQKACRVNLGLNSSICSALESGNTLNYTKEEYQVQGLATDLNFWKTIVLGIIPSVLIIFVGSWSDRNHRRKPCMLVPIIGEFLTSVGLLFCSYYFNELPMGVAGLVESIPPAMTGGWTTMFMSVFSYIGDVTTVSKEYTAITL